MAELVIDRISNDIELNGFSCGNNSIERLIEESYYPTLLKHATAYRVNSKNINYGYYMIRLMNVKLKDLPGDFKEHNCGIFNDCTSLYIKYIAVDSSYQHRGIGTEIVRYIVTYGKEISKSLPIRIIMIDALKDKVGWYKQLGFRSFNEDDLKNSDSTIKMFIDCISDKILIEEYENSIV